MRTPDPRTNVNINDRTIEGNSSPGTPGKVDAPVLRRKLTERQEDRIRSLIHKHLPDELGMPHALWNKFAMRDLIADRLGLRLPNTTLGAYMKRWGFVPEKVLRRAYNEQPTVIRLWVKRQYPLIAAQAKAVHGEVYWSDETRPRTSILPDREARHEDPSVPRKIDHWAGGQTMITIVSNRGQAYWMIQRGPVNSRGLVELLQRSIAGRERKLFLIVPYSPIYENEVVVNWLAANTDRIQVFFLPALARSAARDERMNAHDTRDMWNDTIGT